MALLDLLTREQSGGSGRRHVIMKQEISGQIERGLYTIIHCMLPNTARPGFLGPQGS